MSTSKRLLSFCCPPRWHWSSAAARYPHFVLFIGFCARLHEFPVGSGVGFIASLEVPPCIFAHASTSLLHFVAMTTTFTRVLHHKVPTKGNDVLTLMRVHLTDFEKWDCVEVGITAFLYFLENVLFLKMNFPRYLKALAVGIFCWTFFFFFILSRCHEACLRRIHYSEIKKKE